MDQSLPFRGLVAHKLWVQSYDTEPSKVPGLWLDRQYDIGTIKGLSMVNITGCCEFKFRLY